MIIIDKVTDGIYLRYGIKIPKLDIILALIILVGLIVLGGSILFNGVHFGGAHPGGAPAVSMPVSPTTNQPAAPGTGGGI